MGIKILQIGCNDGDDHVLEFVRTRSDITQVVLVDASLESLCKCKKTYSDVPNCTFLHSAVVPDDRQSVSLFFPAGEGSSQHCSLSRDHLVKHNHKHISAVDVPAININAIIEKHEPVDFLYIDTEGLDSLLVCAIDFAKHKIPHIFFEFVHSDGPFSIGENLDAAVSLLRLNGYKTTEIDTNIQATL
jgi:FkbM family methyltransferase